MLTIVAKCIEEICKRHMIEFFAIRERESKFILPKSASRYRSIRFDNFAGIVTIDTRLSVYQQLRNARLAPR